MIAMQSEQIDQLKSAIGDWHAKYGCIIGKNKKGAHAEYADLTQILDIIAERSPEFGLVLTQKSMPFEGQNCVYTHLFHRPSGQWDASISYLTVIENPSNPDKEWSSSHTKHRRYDGMAILGLFQGDDPADHDSDKMEENPRGNSSFSNAPKESFKLPSQKSDYINENQLRKFNAMAKDTKFPQNAQKAAGYIAKYGAAEKIPWKVFNAIVEDMQTQTSIQQQITETFGAGQLEEVYD